MKDVAYEPWVIEELTRVLRGLFDPGISLRVASREEDLGGVDFYYVVDQSCPIQVRCRFNRPAWAADADITFRTTEPRMIAENTYAPLMVVAWFVQHHIVCARLIDIARMTVGIEPPLKERPHIPNCDGTAFIVVEIGELHSARALLRHYDGRVWATDVLGGEMRLNRILRQHKERQTQRAS